MSAKPVRRAKPHRRANRRPLPVACRVGPAPLPAQVSHVRPVAGGGAPSAGSTTALDTATPGIVADDWLAGLYACDDTPRHRPGFRARLRSRGSRP